MKHHHGKPGIGNVHRIVTCFIVGGDGIGHRLGEIHFRLTAFLLHAVHRHRGIGIGGKLGNELEVVEVRNHQADVIAFDSGHLLAYGVKLRVVGAIPNQLLVQNLAGIP